LTIASWRNPVFSQEWFVVAQREQDFAE